MEAITVFKKGSPERRKLELAAQMLGMNGKKYEVRETYFDYGQDWMWTTIIEVGGKLGDVQVLCPRQQEMIVTAETPEEILEGIRWEYRKEK